jgi:hypothetical protein
MSLSLPIGQNGASGFPSQTGSFENSGQILAGSATASNTVAAQTIITIPAGRTWNGSLAMGASNTATAGTIATATINPAGTGVVPAAAVNLLKVHCSTVGTVASNASANNAIGDITVTAPPGNSVTLTLTNSTATTFASDATASGVLI